VEVHFAPGEPLFVAPATETAVPAFGHFQPEAPEGAQIAGNGMVAVTASEHALQPCALHGDGQLSPFPQLLSNGLHLGEVLFSRHCILLCLNKSCPEVLHTSF
jgi:hypothetical protein